MGILDDLSNTFSKGTAVVERNTRVLMLRTKIGEARARRTTAYSSLGAELYELTRFDPAFRTGREALFDNIASCNAEIEDLESQIAAIEAEAASKKTSVVQPICPVCGAPIAAGMVFCSQCGSRVVHAEAKSTQAQSESKTQSEVIGQSESATQPAAQPQTPGSLNYTTCAQPQTPGNSQAHVTSGYVQVPGSGSAKSADTSAPEQEYEV